MRQLFTNLKFKEMKVLNKYALTEKALKLGYNKHTTGDYNMHFSNHFEACIFSENQHHYCDGWDVYLSNLKWVDGNPQITMFGTEHWVNWFASRFVEEEGTLDLLESTPLL